MENKNKNENTSVLKVCDYHNPHNLTPEQVEASEGWRLLDKNEIDKEQNQTFDGIQVWVWAPRTEWRERKYTGSSMLLTYRTKLTRDQLKLVREQANKYLP